MSWGGLMPLNGAMATRPSDTMCARSGWAHHVLPTPSGGKASVWACHDEWVESGQWRVTKTGQMLFVLGPIEPQDVRQHDRTIRWWVLADDRLKLLYLSDLGEAWLMYPCPHES